MLQSFKRHSNVCTGSEQPNKKPRLKMLAKDITLKYKRTQKKYAQMENQSRKHAGNDICFCCEEPLNEAHVIKLKLKNHNSLNVNIYRQDIYVAFIAPSHSKLNIA